MFLVNILTLIHLLSSKHIWGGRKRGRERERERERFIEVDEKYLGFAMILYSVAFVRF